MGSVAASASASLSSRHWQSLSFAPSQPGPLGPNQLGAGMTAAVGSRKNPANIREKGSKRRPRPGNASLGIRDSSFGICDHVLVA